MAYVEGQESRRRGFVIAYVLFPIGAAMGHHSGTSYVTGGGLPGHGVALGGPFGRSRGHGLGGGGPRESYANLWAFAPGQA